MTRWRCSCLIELVKKRDRDGTMSRRLIGSFVPHEREPAPTANVPSLLPVDGINRLRAERDERVVMMLLVVVVVFLDWLVLNL